MTYTTAEQIITQLRDTLKLWGSISPVFQLVNDHIDYVRYDQIDRACGDDSPKRSPIEYLPRPHGKYYRRLAYNWLLRQVAQQNQDAPI